VARAQAALARLTPREHDVAVAVARQIAILVHHAGLT
jgi:hypothetical protein